ncbi:hypothetical protein [Chloroflexus sp.]|uniref:hypothetical protein n=1 Tax=Chloroflexus sp. TaxID=1904827 RepID=UPI002616C88F|nr:hypothetical protein [uncultured Chloroflexus sp.]
MRAYLPVILILIIAGLLSTAQAQPDITVIWVPLVQAPPPTVAGYLGSERDDTMVAVAPGPAGELIIAGNVPQLDGVNETIIAGGGAGALIRIAPDGRTIASVTRLAPALNAMAMAPNGSVVVCGNNEVIVLESNLTTARWQATLPVSASRCAIAANGQVAILLASTKTILVYSPDGSTARSITVNGTAVADIALDSERGLVFATGYTQAASDLKVAFLRAYQIGNGNLVWQRYGFGAAETKGAGLTADSEGRRLALGADGLLYFAGFTDGGNSIFGRDPANLNRALNSSELIKYDAYNNPANLSGAKSLAWYGRFDPASGTLLRGQWLLTRLSDGKGNSISIRALAAASDGTLLITGDSACCIAGRTGMQLFNQTLGSYELSEPFVLVVNPDFTQRRLWTALAAPGATAGSSPGLSAAITADRIVVGVQFSPNTADTRALITTGNPRFPTRNGGKDAYYLIMPRP